MSRRWVHFLVPFAVMTACFVPAAVWGGWWLLLLLPALAAARYGHQITRRYLIKEHPRQVVIDGYCPFLTCLITQPHAHPVCPDCGAVRYGNAFCGTCKDMRTELNPHRLLGEDEL